MKTLLRFIFGTAIFLLLVPLLALCGMYIYGTYLTHVAEEKLEVVNEQQERAMRAGNGFGGDVGMDIIDSGYRSDYFLWIDNDNLVFRVEYSAYAPKDVQREYVWNTELLTIKPLMTEGGINGLYDGKLRHGKFSETELLPDGKRKPVHFLSGLKELDDRWITEDSENMEDLVAKPPERYELAWREGKPWFRLKTALRSESDVPQHRFRYLWEWGWILRTPRAGPQYFGQESPEMGFFDIGGEIYADQPGLKVADLVDVAPGDLVNLDLVYVGFLGKYWIANDFYGGKPKKKILGFMDRSGRFQKIEWPGGWPEYSGIPLPTRKGIFWTGQDYRLENPDRYDKGAFIKDLDGRVHKAIKGSALRSRLSFDGCRVAFFNPPRPDTGSGASLKVFNVCKSTMDGEELTDVDY